MHEQKPLVRIGSSCKTWRNIARRLCRNGYRVEAVSEDDIKSAWLTLIKLRAKNLGANKDSLAAIAIAFKRGYEVIC